MSFIINVYTYSMLYEFHYQCIYIYSTYSMLYEFHYQCIYIRIVCYMSFIINVYTVYTYSMLYEGIKPALYE